MIRKIFSIIISISIALLVVLTFNITKIGNDIKLKQGWINVETYCSDSYYITYDIIRLNENTLEYRINSSGVIY